MTDAIEVEIAAKNGLSEGVVELVLTPVRGTSLPEWTPGAHIDLILPLMDDSGDQIIRQYSLCGPVQDRSRYKIAILKEQQGRGGSVFIHDQLQAGDRLMINPPRNLFAFEENERCLFIGGGIGITPLIPMVNESIARGLDWQLVYGARTPGHMAYREELQAIDAKRVMLHFDDPDGLIDLRGLLAGRGRETIVYSCGPAGLLDALQSLNQGAEWRLKIERFANDAAPNLEGDSFDVVISSSGQRLTIPSGVSILEVLKQAGIKIESSCKDGLCGTCETAVLKGIPEHRDSVLTPQERAENTYMMVCVSRALSSELILDL